MAQGIEDGYLAACEIHRVDLFLDDKTPKRARDRRYARGLRTANKLTDANTGAAVDR